MENSDRGIGCPTGFFQQQLGQVTQHIQGIVVDLGCGKKPFEALIAPCASHYIGLDNQACEADVVADITSCR